MENSKFENGKNQNLKTKNLKMKGLENLTSLTLKKECQK